jgi:glutathione S-transferase
VRLALQLDGAGSDDCETILNLPGMLEWIEAAKAEPEEVEELEVEF